ncbi:MAG: hypothetical protein R3D33_18465 [Hyphomicrobiaceae bacterium]
MAGPSRLGGTAFAGRAPAAAALDAEAERIAEEAQGQIRPPSSSPA